MTFGQAKELFFFPLYAYPEAEKEKDQKIQTEIQIAAYTFAGDRTDSVNT